MDLAADANFGAARAHQKRRGAFRRRRIAGHFGSGRAARVVAVIAHAGADEQFRLVERPDHHPEFRAADRHSGISRICRLQHRIHRRLIIIAAPAERGLEPIGPMHRILDIDAGIGFVDMIAQHGREELALHRIVQREVDVVIARLKAEHRFGRPIEQRSFEGARGAGAAINAVVVLMELIAVRPDRSGTRCNC